MRELAQSRIRCGYRKIRVLLIREGWPVGKKLVYRLYPRRAWVYAPGASRVGRYRSTAGRSRGRRSRTRCGVWILWTINSSMADAFQR